MARLWKVLIRKAGLGFVLGQAWLAVAAPFAYVATGMDTVSVVDTASDHVVREISVPGIGEAYFGSQQDIVVHPQGHTAYATTDAGVSFIDTASGTVTSVLALDTRLYPMALHPDGSRLYVASLEGSETPRLYVVDTGSRSVMAEIPLDAMLYYGARSMAVSPDGSRLYVGGNDGWGKLLALNAQTLALEAEAYACDWTIPDVKVSPDGERVYAVTFCEWSSEAVVYDAATLTREGDWLWFPGLLPIRLSLHPTDPRMYVLSMADGAAANEVTVLDTNTLETLASIPFHESPWELAMHPDGLSLYASTVESLIIIDTVTLAVRDSLGMVMPSGAGALALGPLPATVGGSATGLALDALACRASGAVSPVMISPGDAHAWDCQAAGLEVLPGQVVSMAVRGVADDNPATVVGGFATGLANLHDVSCRNRSSGQALVLNPVAPAFTWNCEAAGLAVLPGDEIAISLRGRAR